MARADHGLAREMLGLIALVTVLAGAVALMVTTERAAGEPVEVLGTQVTDSQITGGQALVTGPTHSGESEMRVAPPAGSIPVTDTSATTVRGNEVARAVGPEGAGVWALVIGIDEYPGAYDLRAGVADALEVENMLDQAGVPASQRQVLLDGDATLPAVRESLDWLVANAGPRSTALVFFSGHVREVGGDLDGDGEDVDEALLLADGHEYLDGEMADALRTLRARHTWFAIAGCYGGGFDDLLAPGRILTGASPEGELAWENDRFNRTYLVEYMIGRTALAGGEGSVQEAFAEAVAALKVDYPHRLPVMFDQSGAPVTLHAN